MRIDHQVYDAGFIFAKCWADAADIDPALNQLPANIIQVQTKPLTSTQSGLAC